jgi:hypothetical protein
MRLDQYPFKWCLNGSGFPRPSKGDFLQKCINSIIFFKTLRLFVAQYSKSSAAFGS